MPAHSAKRRIVGEIVAAGRGRAAMRGEERGEDESLRGLHGAQPVAVDGVR